MPRRTKRTRKSRRRGQHPAARYPSSVGDRSGGRGAFLPTGEVWHRRLQKFVLPALFWAASTLLLSLTVSWQYGWHDATNTAFLLVPVRTLSWCHAALTAVATLSFLRLWYAQRLTAPFPITICRCLCSVCCPCSRVINGARAGDIDGLLVTCTVFDSLVVAPWLAASIWSALQHHPKAPESLRTIMLTYLVVIGAGWPFVLWLLRRFVWYRRVTGGVYAQLPTEAAGDHHGEANLQEIVPALPSAGLHSAATGAPPQSVVELLSRTTTSVVEIAGSASLDLTAAEFERLWSTKFGAVATFSVHSLLESHAVSAACERERYSIIARGERLIFFAARLLGADRSLILGRIDLSPALEELLVTVRSDGGSRALGFAERALRNALAEPKVGHSSLV